MVIRYIKGENLGESRNADAILKVVSLYNIDENCKHIKCIINQGCPSHLDFEEDYENKHAALCKGNQHIFLRQPDVTTKAMNKEERNSHVLPFKHWTVYFLPFLQSNPSRNTRKIWQVQGDFKFIHSDDPRQSCLKPSNANGPQGDY
jgi:hypothetical protein